LKNKNQLEMWLDENECLRLQKRWGDYETFETNPNIKNKLEIIKLLKKITEEYLNNEGTIGEIGIGSGHFANLLKYNCKKIKK
jgi:hypothetical protein